MRSHPRAGTTASGEIERTALGPQRHFATLGSSRSNVVALVVGSTGQRRSSFQVDRPVAYKSANVSYPRPPTLACVNRLAATSLNRKSPSKPASTKDGASSTTVGYNLLVGPQSRLTDSLNMGAWARRPSQAAGSGVGPLQITRPWVACNPPRNLGAPSSERSFASRLDGSHQISEIGHQ